MPTSLYSREEIDAFVQNNLRIVGENSLRNADALRANFADAIEQLPPEQQTILIETRRTNITGDNEIIQDLFSKSDPVAGFFYPGHRLGDEFKHQVQDPIVWATDARGREGTITALHEQGHRTDAQINSFQGGKRWGYWSDSNPGWGEALEVEKMAMAPSDTRNPLPWISRQIRKLTGNVSPDEPLYPHARKLVEHLELYKDVSTHPREAFAEVSNHYMSLYTEHEGDEAAVDRLLTNEHPKLWPVYRDEFLPVAQEYANHLQESRAGLIDRYVRAERELFQAIDEPFDEAKVRKQAGIYAAEGSILRQAEIAERRMGIYKDPVSAYVSTKISLMEKRDSLQGRSGRVIDEQALKAEAGAIIDKEGKRGLINIRDSQVQETQLLERFENRTFQNDQIMADALGVEPQYTADADILQRFDALKEQGGLDAIRTELEKPRLPKEAIASYVYARHEQADVRTRLGEPVQLDPAQLRADIEAMSGPNMRESLDAAKRGLREETQLLERFESRTFQNDKILADALGVEPQYTADADILQRFDALKEQGGLDTIRTELEKPRLPEKPLERYFDARRDLAYDRWKLEYPSHWSRQANPFVFDHEAAATDALRIFKEDGKTALVETAQELRTESRLLENFEDRISHKDKILAETLDIEPQYTSGTDILQRFDALKEQGGLDAIRTELEKPRLPKETTPDLAQVSAEGAPHGLSVSASDIKPEAADGLLHRLGKNGGLIGGAVIGAVVGVVTYTQTSDAGEALQATIEMAIPYGETGYDLAEGDLKAAARSATVETTANIGGAAAAITGAAAGAALGSALPIVGTAIGAVAGGIIGGIGGGVVVGAATDYVLDHGQEMINSTMTTLDKAGTAISETATNAWSNLTNMFNGKADPQETNLAMAANNNNMTQPTAEASPQTQAPEQKTPSTSDLPSFTSGYANYIGNDHILAENADSIEMADRLTQGAQERISAAKASEIDYSRTPTDPSAKFSTGMLSS